ncbi:MAG TPA: hypothetical protein VGO68_02725 [Pyrinomonadaceae bacterium]|jgi:hypothetical protein|nr:hypothetical protein [Pyrinomonadaceae bacterium]
MFPKANQRKLQTAIIAAALLLAVSVLPAQTKAASLVSLQQDDGPVMIKTADGAIFVWNASGISFSLALKGAEIKRLEDPEHIFLSVDGRLLQIQLAAIKNFAPDAKEKRLDDKAILTAHRDWESKYIEQLIKSKLTLRTFNAKLSIGSEALMWQFDMPEGMNSEAQKQLYLTLVAKDYVLMLNSEASAAISDADGRKFLLDTIATLKFSPTPIDVQKLSESIRAGSKP